MNLSLYQILNYNFAKSECLHFGTFMIINIVYKNNKCPVRIQYIRRYNMITDIFNHKYHTMEKSIIDDDSIVEMITRKHIVCIVFNRILLKLNEK